MPRSRPPARYEVLGTALSLLCALALACTSKSESSAPSSQRPPSREARTSPPREEKARDEKARVTEALRRGVEWAAALEVNPLQLRAERNMKGIKHFVEYLDILRLAYRWKEDPALSERAKKLAFEALLVTENNAYHALDPTNEKRFKEDSMSYLRACWLAKELGWDTSGYRAKIEALLPAIQSHLPGRGVDQRMGFALLFRQLGLPIVETEEAVYPESLIARHEPISYYAVSPDRPYDITHEIFAMTWRGERPFPFPSEEDERYAKETVRELLRSAIAKKNLDLSAELLVNLVELGEASSLLAREARELILSGQNPDGSFGDYRREAAELAKRNPLYSVQIGGYLHTTMVCLWALVETS